MGGRIIALSTQDKEFKVVGAVEIPRHPNIGKNIWGVLGIDSFSCKITDDLQTALKDADVLIEFTTAESTVEDVKIAKKMKRAAVVGTTGLNETQVGILKEASKAIPIVYSPNMSLGVNTLFAMLPEIAKRLGPDYYVE